MLKLKRVDSRALSTYVQVLLPLAIFLIGYSPMSMADSTSRYIRKSSDADTVIVFVHGFMGDAVSTWTSTSGYWPEMLTKDRTFDATDIFVYSYPTGFISTLSIDELAENMRSVLTAYGVSAYNKIIFLSHSMGGLVSRAYLLKNRDIGARTAFAYFFSTPTTGTQIASIAQYLLSTPQLAKMQSVSAEDYLADLLRQWLAAGFKFPSYCAYEKRRTKGIALVVSMDSAVALCTKAVDPIDADHVSIVKPEGEDSAPYIAFKAAYVEVKAQTVSIDAHSLVIDVANTVVARFVLPHNTMNGNMGLLLYNLRIVNMFDRNITPREVSLSYSLNGKRYIAESLALLTSPIGDKRDDSIIVSSYKGNIVLLGRRNIREKLGEYQILPPGGVMAGSAAFIFQFNDAEDILRLQEVRITVTDYTGHETEQAIPVQKSWIDNGRLFVVQNKRFTVNPVGTVTYME